MNKIVRLFQSVSFVVCGIAILTSCSKSRPTAENPGGVSTATGLEYNSDGGFQVNDFEGQPAGPNLVYIEGGRSILGSFEEDILNSRDNIERTVTVASFYMDETEVSNIHWTEYLYYVKLDSSREFYQSALPDTTVWTSELAFNDPYREHYLRYPGFRFYPVVGVSWIQANDYCEWRTNMVNLKLAEDAGVEVPAESGGRIALESGVVIPNYRLPTEAEWEYAAQALIGTQWLDENQTHQRIYPWDGHALRNPYGKTMGSFLANFKRGRGDYAGIAGKLNDGAMITAYAYEYPPNDFGLFHMAGNVNEWVQDLYRPLSFQDVDDLNPIRRNGYLDGEDYYDFENYNSLINDKVRVFKGGSWKDVAYWMSPGTRRFLEEDSSTATIGFRCAMISAGSNY
ncbi:gliding motility lipoprotein GldJ [Fulvivirgaceae bacterium BMA10]|uniref:Gliding motility lipoprotein GldJ n=1 Tax=Splendidivirga corallicola TaxID=3051826 RepID=A0ABT8KMR8_9BACT|nr:gliding motility lipoprotein GldJ [Fulvivirgaceae bacterium BMA10]